MSLAHPRIDVIIPAYNAERFIEEAVRSALNQVLTPQKVIVVDDGSADGTFQVLSVLQREYSASRLEILRHENKGPSAARNAGIRASNAEFLAFLDADDVWERNKLELQWGVFRETRLKRLGVVYCDYSNIGEDGEVLKGGASFRLDPSIRGHVHPRLYEGNLISSSNSGVLVKSECFREAGLFDEKLRAAEDWDMWLRISRHYEFDFAPEKLVRIRRLSASNSSDSSRLFFNDLNMLWKHYPVDPEKVSIQLKRTIARAPSAVLFKELFADPSKHGLLEMLRDQYPDCWSRLRAHVLFALYDRARAVYRIVFSGRIS